MKYPHLVAASLCCFILTAGISDAATKDAKFAAANKAPAPKAPAIKLRKTQGYAETLVDLTPEGTKLEAEYIAKLEALREEITKALPAVDASQQKTLIELLKAEQGSAKQLADLDKGLRNTRTSEDKYNALVEKLRATPGFIAKAENDLKKALALPDSDPTKEKLVSNFQKNVENSKKNLAKLPIDIEKAKVAFDNAGAEEVRLMKEVEAANKARANAKAETWKGLDSLGLGDLLSSDALDAKLAQFIVLSEYKPRFAAQFTQQGPEKKKLLDDLLANTPLMLQMLVADGPIWGKYGEAMEIYQAIQKASPKASEGVLQRMAVATSLAHAVPMRPQLGSEAAATNTVNIDPLKRYMHYEKAFLAGELDPAFKDLSTWELRYVAGGEDPDEALAWAREMIRAYRPDLMKRGYADLRYSQITDAEIQYTSSMVPEDRPELLFMQNILANGGICGRRAFFARLALRAFGIPTMPRKEPGHATLAQWTPDGWLTYLGGQWGGRATIERYGRDINFLVNSQARGNESGFMKVKRAQWIGDVMGEPMIFGLEDPKKEPQLWYAISLAEQNRAADGKKAVVPNSAPIPSTTVEAPAAERTVTVDSAGVITIPAVATKIPADNMALAAWGNHPAVTFMESHENGMQLYYSRYGGNQVLEYTFDAPKAGNYELTSRIASSRWDMSFLVSANGAAPVEMAIPYNLGLWETSKPIVVELKAGSNILTFARPEDSRKGIAIKDFTLTPVK